MSIFTRCLPKDETQTESPSHSRASSIHSLLAREIHDAPRVFARRLAQKFLGCSRRHGKQQQSGLRVVYTFAVKTTVYSTDGLMSQLYGEPRGSAGHRKSGAFGSPLGIASTLWPTPPPVLLPSDPRDEGRKVRRPGFARLPVLLSSSWSFVA